MRTVKNYEELLELPEQEPDIEVCACEEDMRVYEFCAVEEDSQFANYEEIWEWEWKTDYKNTKVILFIAKGSTKEQSAQTYREGVAELPGFVEK